MKIGIPRALFYYIDGDILINFFKKMDIDVIVSPKTTKKIIEDGIVSSPDEMCLSIKNYIGHVNYLKDKCDYILIPRIDNYYTFNQTCTNFLASRDIINNIFDVKILDYNIDLNNKQTLKKGLSEIAKKLGKKKGDILYCYHYAINKYKKDRKILMQINNQKLNGEKTKVLLISHSYNVYDDLIGKPIVSLFEKEGVDVIYSDLFDKSLCRKLSQNISKDLYWKYSKESIGSFEIVKDRINGVVFLSTFPCGLDSLVNELMILKLNIPYLNIIIDDINASNGIETRIESFVDIIKNYK